MVMSTKSNLLMTIPVRCSYYFLFPINEAFPSAFPPRDSFPHLNLELSDHSEAPRKYAEDFYSGGEPRLPAGAQAHLDEDIEVIEEAEELSRMDEVDHSSETCKRASYIVI